jgi:hypothetical protein
MKASLRHNNRFVSWLTLILGAGGTWLGVVGCSTTNTLSPHAPPKEVEVPAYAYLPHPEGHTISDVISLFSEKEAPSRETMAKCEDDFRALYSQSQSIEERTKGVQELVSRNPAAYHWCFYSQILKLEEGLSKDDFVDQKQKRIMSAYEYLVPVARAFMKEYHDSRYLRWAIQDYRRLADLYFYRKLEMSPQMSSELVDVAVPAEYRSAPAAESSRPVSVLEKYKIGDSIPESAVVAKLRDQKEEKAEAVPPPAAPVVKAEEPKKVEATDPETRETIEYAEELARERKEAEAAAAEAAQRAPASVPAPKASQPAPAVMSPVTKASKEELPALE